MKAKSQFLTGRNAELFRKHYQKRSVKRAQYGSRPLKASERGRKITLHQALMHSIAPSSSPRSTAFWRLSVYLTPEGNGCSACCQEAMDAARQSGQYPAFVVQGTHDLDGLPGILKELGCKRKLIRYIAKKGAFRDPPRIFFKLTTLILAVSFATLAAVIMSATGIGPRYADGSTLVIVGAIVVVLNLAAAIARGYFTERTGGAQSKELAAILKRFVAAEKRPHEFDEMVRICATTLLAKPRIVVVDAFSRLDRFTGEVLLAAFTEEDLRRDAALIVIVVDYTRDFLNCLAVARQGVDERFADVKCYAVEPLSLSQRRTLCCAAGTNESLASSLNLNEILDPTHVAKREEEERQEVERNRRRRNRLGEFEVSVEDILRLGYCRHGARISVDDLCDLCCARSSHLGRLSASFKVVRLSRETVWSQIDRLRETSEELFEDNYVRLDWLRGHTGIPPEVKSVLYLAWSDYWLLRATNENAPSSWLRVGAEMASKVDWDIRLARNEDGRAILLRFFEVSRRAIQECFRMAMLAVATELSKCITRAWADVGRPMREEHDEVARRLEQILHRTVWESMAVTLDREELVDAIGVAAQEENLEVKGDVRASDFDDSSTWWDWFLRLTGVSEESLGVARRILLATDDRRLNTRSKWVIWAGLYFELLSSICELEIPMPVSVEFGFRVGSHGLGDAVPGLSETRHPKYWDYFVDACEDELQLVTILSVMAMAIRGAIERREPRVALNGIKWLLEIGRDFDQPGKWGSILNRAMLLEARTLALETILANAVDDDRFWPQAGEGGVRFRQKHIPARVRKSCMDLMEEVDPSLTAEFSSRADGAIPYAWFDRIDNEYFELTLLWRQLGLSRREAWCKIWRVRFMVRESDASPLQSSFAANHLSLLQEAANVEGVQGYAADALALRACRDFVDFASSYRYRLALRTWRLGQLPHLAVFLTRGSMLGGRLGVRELHELVQTMLRHMGGPEGPSRFWRALDPSEQAILCRILILNLVALQRDAPCLRVCDFADELLKDPGSLGEGLAPLRLEVKAARLVCEFAPEDGDQILTFLERWEDDRSTREYVDYAVELWRRANGLQCRVAANTYAKIFGEIDGEPAKDWLVRNVVPRLEKSGITLADGDLAVFQEWVRILLQRRRFSLTFEDQASLAGFYRSTMNVREKWVDDILDSATVHQLNRDWIEKVQEGIRLRDPLAILLIYYKNVRTLGIPRGVQNEERFERALASQDGEAIALFYECPPVLLQGASERLVCVDFFLLAEHLVAGRGITDSADGLLEDAKEIAANNLEAFLDVVISATDDLKHISHLLKEHRDRIAASFRFDELVS